MRFPLHLRTSPASFRARSGAPSLADGPAGQPARTRQGRATAPRAGTASTSGAPAARQTTVLRAPLEPQARRVQEQVNPTFLANSPTQEDWYWGRTASGTEEDYFWRRLSDNWYQKDVIPSTYLEIHNQCYEAYNANPLAFAIIEMTTAFVLGKGITVAAAHPRVQKVIDAFWHDPDNHMDERIYSICTELALYGEQFIRFFVNPINGAVKIGQIDPSIIDQIESDPENIEKPLRVHRRPIGPSATIPGQPAMPQQAENFEGRWFTVPDEVMQFCINKVSNAKRGHSDLATLIPWLRRYKDWLTDRVRINKYRTAFIWDVTVQGADRKTLAAKQSEWRYPPEPGTVIFHNEAEQWEAKDPKILADQVAEDGRAIKLMIAVGAGLPEHYLSDGQNANRATAAEMGLPTLLKFQRRQKTMEHILRCILDRVIAEARVAGVLPKSASDQYDILFPEIDTNDNASLAMATSTLINALVTAHQMGWASRQTCMRLFYTFAGEEVDVFEELQRIAAEDNERPEDTNVSTPRPAAPGTTPGDRSPRQQRPDPGATFPQLATDARQTGIDIGVTRGSDGTFDVASTAPRNIIFGRQ